MKIQTISYKNYEEKLPQHGNWIIGQESNGSLIVYQAFNHAIADYAVAHQKFGGSAYSFSRMSWIKPNFLWMMYRAGWATKPNQERILAIKIAKQAFETLLEEGVYSSYQADKYENRESWQHALIQSEVRIQWDPDHDPHGAKLQRRAIQIGIKGKRLRQFNEEFINEITDISEFVNEQRTHLNDLDLLEVVHEAVIDPGQALRKKYSISESYDT